MCYTETSVTIDVKASNAAIKQWKKVKSSIEMRRHGSQVS